MTEEFWQSYKKNKDLAQPNQFWRNVIADTGFFNVKF